MDGCLVTRAPACTTTTNATEHLFPATTVTSSTLKVNDVISSLLHYKVILTGFRNQRREEEREKGERENPIEREREREKEEAVNLFWLARHKIILMLQPFLSPRARLVSIHHYQSQIPPLSLYLNHLNSPLTPSLTFSFLNIVNPTRGTI